MKTISSFTNSIQYFNIFLPYFWKHFKLFNFTVLIHPLYGGVLRSMELKIYIPFFRPRWQQINIISMDLHQHLLQSYHTRSTPIVVRNPVKSWPPECWEPSFRIFKLQGYVLFRFIH